jgi:glycosyltransferase involved in cell wall biosynthesis
VRILALSWTPVWPPSGGASVRAYALLSRLKTHDLRLVAPGPFPPGMQGEDWRTARRRAFGFNLDTLVRFSPLARRRARAAACAFEPDLVLAFGIWSAGMASEVDAPMVLDASHVELVTAREGGRSRPACALVELIESRALRQARRVWTVSAEDGRRFAGLYRLEPERLRIVPNGVDLQPSLAEPPRHPFRVLFVGRGSFAPNRDAIRFLLREVRPRLPGVVLRLVGAAPVPCAEGLELVRSCDALAPHYACSSVVCAPVVSGTGTRIKVLEAAAFGRPLVATRRAVEGLGLEAGQHYLEAHGGEGFVRAIARLENDPLLATRIAAAARQHVLTHLLWDDIARAAERDLAALV